MSPDEQAHVDTMKQSHTESVACWAAARCGMTLEGGGATGGTSCVPCGKVRSQRFVQMSGLNAIGRMSLPRRPVERDGGDGERRDRL